jgi:putative phage-type endonuclease
MANNSNVIPSKLDLAKIKTDCIELFKEYVTKNILELSKECFDIKVTDYIYNHIIYSNISINNTNNSNNNDTNEKIRTIVKKTIKTAWCKVIPYRSYCNSFIRNVIVNKTHLDKKLEYLRNAEQPAQRTDEWYAFRHNLLTASSIWKVFGSEPIVNSIIYEKCKSRFEFAQQSLDSPMHWGQKYEPISVQLYEHTYNTVIEEFGCIQHKKYYFIGASPDGINMDPNNGRYGRMLEIKNVVSRTITGIPKMDYWIQVQVQLETCDLNECDFLETKFVEYDGYDEFINDGTFNYSNDNKQKGVILLFSKNGNTYYEYPELLLSQEDYNVWEENTINEKNVDSQWLRTIYWKLEVFSNVLILRNKLWFEYALPKIKDVWDTIEKERIEGCDHRAPKKRVYNNNNNNNNNHNNNYNNNNYDNKYNKLVNKCFISITTTN